MGGKREDELLENMALIKPNLALEGRGDVANITSFTGSIFSHRDSMLDDFPCLINRIKPSNNSFCWELGVRVVINFLDGKISLCSIVFSSHW